MQRLSGLYRRSYYWLVPIVILTAGVLLTTAITRQTAPTPYVSASRYRTPEPPTPSAPISVAAPLYIFPAGGQTLLPAHRFVALYGSPGVPQLGVMGEYNIDHAIQRAKEVAAEYQPFSKERVYPTLEIIASVASASPTENGDYSREVDIAVLQPWVDAAKQAGVYVLLDLQPGRSTFLDQARQYEPLLREPHVGLALDPEWRIGPEQVHLAQIGSVGIDEVNDTASWLANLTAQYRLPQKLFLLHQFKLSMLPGRERLNTTRIELAYVIQMDGHGTQSVKIDTWNVIRRDAPEQVWFGWKQFYDEDRPLASPEEAMRIDPQPWYISYQ